MTSSEVTKWSAKQGFFCLTETRRRELSSERSVDIKPSGGQMQYLKCFIKWVSWPYNYIAMSARQIAHCMPIAFSTSCHRQHCQHQQRGLCSVQYNILPKSLLLIWLLVRSAHVKWLSVRSKGQIPFVRYPDRRPTRESASELDSVMEFGKFHYAI